MIERYINIRKILVIAFMMQLCSSLKLKSMILRKHFEVSAMTVAYLFLNVASVDATTRRCGSIDFNLEYIGSGGSGTVFKAYRSRRAQS